MIISSDFVPLQALARLAATPLVESESLPWAPGAQVQAQVLAPADAGRFRVRIDGLLLDMDLPAEVRPGQKLNLTVVALEPRPTFVVAPPEAPPGAPVQISDAGRKLALLLDRIDREPAAPSPAPPLLARSQAPADLMPALREALAKSGLFYESHQAQWATGERPVRELFDEPQGRLSPALRSPPLGAASAGEIGASGISAPVHPDAVGTVQQQLQALDMRQIVWRGQVWPGETLEWRVDERQAPFETGGAPAWHTTLAVQLPQLGEVRAQMSLMGDEVRVSLRADSAAAAALEERAGALGQSLAAAGLALRRFALDPVTDVGAGE